MKAEILKNLIVIILLYLFYIILKPFLATLVLAIVISILSYPIYQYLISKLKINTSIASLVTVFGSLLFIFLPLAFLLTLLINQSVQFVSGYNTNELFESLQNFNTFTVLGYSIDFELIQSAVISSFNDVGKFIAQNSAQILTGIFNSIGLLIVFITLYFYLLRDGKQLLEQFRQLLPYDNKQKDLLVNSFITTSKTVIIGNFIVAFASAVIALIGFKLAGFEATLIWSAIAFILAFIPTLGPIILYLVGAISLFFSSGLLSAFLLIIYFVVFELVLKENILKAKVLDSKFNAHPVLVLLSLVGGVSAFGTIGLFYGPLILLLLLTLLQFNKKTLK